MSGRRTRQAKSSKGRGRRLENASMFKWGSSTAMATNYCVRPLRRRTEPWTGVHCACVDERTAATTTKAMQWRRHELLMLLLASFLLLMLSLCVSLLWLVLLLLFSFLLCEFLFYYCRSSYYYCYAYYNCYHELLLLLISMCMTCITTSIVTNYGYSYSYYKSPLLMLRTSILLLLLLFFLVWPLQLLLLLF